MVLVIFRPVKVIRENAKKEERMCWIQVFDSLFWVETAVAFGEEKVRKWFACVTCVCSLRVFFSCACVSAKQREESRKKRETKRVRCFISPLETVRGKPNVKRKQIE